MSESDEDRTSQEVASTEIELKHYPKAVTNVPNDPAVDDALVMAALTDAPAFLELYDRWAVPVYRYFLSMMQDVACAEDLTSKLFLKLWQVLPSYRLRGNFAGWIFRIAHNLAMDLFRKENRELKFVNGLKAELPLHLHEMEDPRLPQLKAVLGRRRAEEIELLRLRFSLELEFSQIATILGKSEQAARKQLYRLLNRMRQDMEVNHENPSNQ